VDLGVISGYNNTKKWPELIEEIKLFRMPITGLNSDRKWWRNVCVLRLISMPRFLLDRSGKRSFRTQGVLRRF